MLTVVACVIVVEVLALFDVAIGMVGEGVVAVVGSERWMRADGGAELVIELKAAGFARGDHAHDCSRDIGDRQYRWLCVVRCRGVVGCGVS